MSDKTEAQQARSEADRDWAASETIDKKFASRSEVLAVWSIADSAFNRAEEVAASVTALTERVDALERMRNPQELLKPISVLANRVEATERQIRDHVHVQDGRMACPAYPTDPPPPPPPPDAGEPFVDALDVLSGMSEDDLLLAKSVLHVGMPKLTPEYLGRLDAMFDALRVLPEARAAALPERSAPAPVTITKERITEKRLDVLLHIWVERFRSAQANEHWYDERRPALAAVLRELGYEVAE